MVCLQYKSHKNLSFYLSSLFFAHLVSIIVLPGVKAKACGKQINSVPAACRLLSWWPSRLTRLQCDVVAWQQWAKLREGKGREPGSRLQWEQGDKQGKAHNPPVYSVQTKPSQQWHTAAPKKRAESLKYVLKKANKRSQSVETRKPHYICRMLRNCSVSYNK